MTSNMPRRESSLRIARKNAMSRPYNKNHEKTMDGKMNFKEKLLMQCIVCGIILASVLLVKVINANFTNRLQDNLKIALTESITMEDVTDTFEYVSTTIKNISDSSVLGNENETLPYENIEPEPAAENENLPENTANQKQEPESTPAPAENITINIESGVDDNEFRIDEDILNEINNTEDIYNSQKKPVAPN